MIARGMTIALFAVSLGGCSHVGSMWGKLTGSGDHSVHAAAAPDPQVCATLRISATPDSNTEAASRQMAIDEMKRVGCPEVPAL